VYQVNGSVPDAIMSRLLDRFEEATKIEALIPRAMAGYSQKFYQNFSNGNFESVDIVIDDAVFSQLYDLYPGTISDCESADNVKLNGDRLCYPFAIWISQGRKEYVNTIVYTENGVRGIIENDTQEAVRWGQNVIRDKKSSADQIII